MFTQHTYRYGNEKIPKEISGQSSESTFQFIIYHSFNFYSITTIWMTYHCLVLYIKFQAPLYNHSVGETIRAELISCLMFSYRLFLIFLIFSRYSKATDTEKFLHLDIYIWWCDTEERKLNYLHVCNVLQKSGLTLPNKKLC